MVHSQSGAYGMELVRARAIKMLGFINVEGNCAPVTPEEVVKIFEGAAAVGVGRQQPGRARAERRRAPQWLHVDRQRREVRGRLRQVPAAAGGRPEGNSHMLMMDKNNLQIADLIIGWLGENVPAR